MHQTQGKRGNDTALFAKQLAATHKAEERVCVVVASGMPLDAWLPPTSSNLSSSSSPATWAPAISKCRIFERFRTLDRFTGSQTEAPHNLCFLLKEEEKERGHQVGSLRAGLQKNSFAEGSTLAWSILSATSLVFFATHSNLSAISSKCYSPCQEMIHCLSAPGENKTGALGNAQAARLVFHSVISSKLLVCCVLVSPSMRVSTRDA